VREERYDMDVWEAHVKACKAAGVSPSPPAKPPTPSKPPTGFIAACVPCTPASTSTGITTSRIPPHTLARAPASSSGKSLAAGGTGLRWATMSPSCHIAFCF
jgi:hypothetical protein